MKSLKNANESESILRKKCLFFSKIDDLMKDNSSFIYGQNPNLAQVPIYAMVSLCDFIPPTVPNPSLHLNGKKLIIDKISQRLIHQILEINYNFNERQDTSTRIPYIPINIPEPFPYAFDQSKNITTKHQNGSDQNDLNNSIPNREKRDLDTGGLDVIDGVGIDYGKPMTFQRPVTVKVKNEEKMLPSFHVTYWMFYPYSQVDENESSFDNDFILKFSLQGKTMCTINLGPLGRLPIPLIFGMCLGTKKDFGSHIGDWEHMSLYFKGRSEPEVNKNFYILMKTD